MTVFQCTKMMPMSSRKFWTPGQVPGTGILIPALAQQPPSTAQVPVFIRSQTGISILIYVGNVGMHTSLHLRCWSFSSTRRAVRAMVLGAGEGAASVRGHCTQQR